MAATLPIRLVYRSRNIQYPLIAAISAADGWARAGLDPGADIPYVKGASDGDGRLLRREIDFVFGSHVTPYLRYDEGKPFVYLGQTVNWVDDAVASARPIGGLADLRGLRIGDDVGHESHPHGNHILYLRREGVGQDEVEWVHIDRKDALEALKAGRIDATFVSPPDDELARMDGLAVHVPPMLPMVQATTLTTRWDVVREQPDLCRSLAKAVRLGIAFFQDESEAMWRVMEGDVATSLGIKGELVLRTLYERNCRLLERSLYPRPQAIENAFQLAVLQRPDLPERLVPTALWDVHFLRELDAEERAA